VVIFNRNFLLVIGLILMANFVASEKNIECVIKYLEWKIVNQVIPTCDVRYQSINSTGFALSTISAVQGILIPWNPSVEFLPENLDKKFENVTVYYAMRCSIKKIEKSNFKGVLEMRFLNLHRNKIDMIENDAFLDNLLLQQIDLSHNEIKYVEDFHYSCFIHTQFKISSSIF
jgi:hypothetical protein